MAWSKITAVRLFVLAVCLLNAFSDAAVKKTRKRVVCYYTNWSVYRQGLAKFLPNNINPHLCTHLIYAFGGFNDDFELQPFDKYQDIEKGGYARFNGLKQYNKGMRTLLALGGWNEGSGRFSELVADAEYRKRFAYSAIRYLRQYNFDGLDLDWEYPGSRAGSDPSDKENYATLCEELRAVFEAESIKTNRPVLLLTVAVPAGISTIENGFNVPRLNAVVDFFNILAYDYHASSEPLTDHHAPLMALPGASEYDYRTELNVDYTVRFYLKSGAERRKLVVGIPTYGRSYTLIDGQFNGLQAAAESPGLKGKYTKEDGYLSFYEVCEMVAVDEWQVYRPYPELMGPYATKDRQWVGYDDEFAAAKKAEYVRDNRLGGIMFWSVDNDDFRGRCSGQPYPLIEAAKKAYLSPIPGSPPKQQKGPTPAPPPTPDPGADFECKREGFYPHPNECNKYFWCLSGGALGLVPHRFTCPTGLLFNRNTDACDFPRSVKCKVAEKKVESITFPPTPEPIITRTPAVIGSTENPFDDYYEEYDTGSLPELDLDFPDLSDDLFTPAKTTPTVEVLGGSRGGASAIQTSSFSLSSPEEDSEESDPAELKQLLSLIQNLGGVEGVQRLLQGESSSSFISEKERKALTKIVDKQQGLQRTRPEAVNSNSLRSRTRGSSQSSTSSNTRSQPRPSSSSSNRGRNPQEGAFGDSALTDSVANTRTNTRRRPATSSSESRRQTAGVNRRRPQYTSIQRDRSPQRGQSVVVEENEGFEEPQLANVQISRPTIVNDFRATNDQSRRQQTIGSSDSRRQYLTLERGRGESGRQELTDASLAEFGGVEDEALRAAFQVVARRSDGPVDPALALLPALTGLTTFTASEPDRSGALYSPNGSLLNQETPVVRVQRRRRPESAAIDVDVLLFEEEAFNPPRQARQSRRRTLSNERGRFGQEDSERDTINEGVEKPVVQQQQPSQIARTRGRGSTRFTLRRGSRRRTPTVQTTETDQQTAATEVDVTEPLPTEAAVVDVVTEPEEIAVAEATTESSSETGRSRGTGRYFRLGGRRPVGRARTRPTEEASAEEVQRDEPELLVEESVQDRQPQIPQQVERPRQRVTRPRLRQRGRAPFRSRDDDDSSDITPQLTARRVPQTEGNVLSSVVGANEATTTTEEPVVSGVPLRRRTPFNSRERPDPLTRARPKLRVTPTSEIAATDVPSTTELIVPSTVSEESETEEDELTEIDDYTEEVSYPSSTTEESRPPPRPFSRPLSGSSRVRPFPFRPRGNRRPVSATTRPANPFISEPEVEDVSSTESLPESSVSLPSTTERASFSLTDLFPGVRTSTSSSVDDDSEELTASPTDADDSEEESFRFSTLPSRRSSTIRPPYRTRPTSSVSLYDLVQNRDDDEKRLKVQSLVEQLKSSLSGQRHLVTTALPVSGDDLEEADDDSDDIGTTSSSASVSVSTTERHSTVSIFDDDEVTEIVVLPTAAGTTFRLTSPTKSIETTTELQPVFYLGTDAEVFSATTEQPEGTVLPFLPHDDSDDQDSDDESDLDVTDLETDGWVVTPRTILKTSDREGRVLVVGPSDPRTSTTSARPKFFTESNGAFIVTAATIPPSPVDSFVSVKVSVSSSDSESSQSTSVSDEQSSTSESAVDALFKMLSLKEREEASRPLDEEDHDQAEQAEQLNGPVLQASLFNRPPAVSQYEVQNPNRVGKPTLYDQEGILAFSTVTPRYDDPDSLFKRKTYISGAGLCVSPVSLIIAAFSAVLLLQHRN